MIDDRIPPLPEGFVLDSPETSSASADAAPPPAGFVVDRPARTLSPADPVAAFDAARAKANAPTVDANAPSFTGSFAQGFKRTLPEDKELVGAAGIAAGQLIGSRGLTDASLGLYQRGKEQAEPFTTPSLEDVWNGKEPLRNWVGGTLGNLAGQAVQSAAAAAIGGLAGGAAGSEVPGVGNAAGAVVGGVAGLVGRKAVMAKARELAEQYIADKVASGVARDVAEKGAADIVKQAGVGAARTIGATTGAFIPNAAQEIGSAVENRLDQGVDSNASAEDQATQAAQAAHAMTPGQSAQAIAAGTAAGAVDTLAEGLNVARYLKGSANPHVVRRVLSEAAGGAAREGATEVAQSFLERLGGGASLADANAMRDYIESGAAGALGGGVFDAPAGLRKHAGEHGSGDEKGAGSPPSADSTPPAAGQQTLRETITPEAVTARAQATLDALDRKANGTPDQDVTDPETGITRTVSGEKPQLLTDREKRARQWLSDNIGDPQALADKLRLDLVEPAPAAPAAAPEPPKVVDPVTGTASPIPDPAAGSISKVVNKGIQTGAVQTTDNVVQPDMLGGEPITATPAAAEEAPPRLPPAVPWIDANTGEVHTPSDDEVKDAFHRLFANASTSGGNFASLTRASKDRADEWGIPQDRLNALRTDALAERAGGFKAGDVRAQVADALQSAEAAPDGSGDLLQPAVPSHSADISPLAAEARAPGADADAGAIARVAAVSSEPGRTSGESPAERTPASPPAAATEKTGPVGETTAAADQGAVLPLPATPASRVREAATPAPATPVEGTQGAPLPGASASTSMEYSGSSAQATSQNEPSGSSGQLAAAPAVGSRVTIITGKHAGKSGVVFRIGDLSTGVQFDDGAKVSLSPKVVRSVTEASRTADREIAVTGAAKVEVAGNQPGTAQPSAHQPEKEGESRDPAAPAVAEDRVSARESNARQEVQAVATEQPPSGPTQRTAMPSSHKNEGATTPPESRREDVRTEGPAAEASADNTAVANVADNFRLSPAQALQLQEAHRALGRDVTYGQVKRLRDRVAAEVESGFTSSGGVRSKLRPKAIESRRAQLARLDHDAALFERGGAQQLKETGESFNSSASRAKETAQTDTGASRDESSTALADGKFSNPQGITAESTVQHSSATLNALARLLGNKPASLSIVMDVMGDADVRALAALLGKTFASTAKAGNIRKNLATMSREEQTQAARAAAIALYRAHAEREAGNPDYYATDLAKELFPEYNASNEARRDNNDAVQSAASRIALEAFMQRLREPARKGERPVTLMAGGAGAGKTTVVPKTGIVYDSTSWDIASTRRNIQSVLDSGRRASIRYVFNDPVEAFKRMLDRGQNKIGRVVELHSFANTHRGAYETVKALRDEFSTNKRVGIQVFDNRGADAVEVEAAPDFDYNALTEKLQNVLDTEHAAGRISDETYFRVAGVHPRAGAGAAEERGLRIARDSSPAAGTPDESGALSRRGGEPEGRSLSRGRDGGSGIDRGSEPAQPQGLVDEGQAAQSAAESKAQAAAPSDAENATAGRAAAAPSRAQVTPSANTFFTKDAYDAARARMKARFGHLNSGFDPLLMIDGVTAAGYHIERGMRTFAAYAKAMVEDFGEGVRPYLLYFYEGVRTFPGFNADGMSSVEDAKRQHEAAVAKVSPSDAVGKVSKAQPKERKGTKGPNRILRQDWGTSHIDGWGELPGGKNEQGDRGVRGGVKDAFLADSKAYLKEVATLLEKRGFEAVNAKRGAVSVNPAGPAVSGDVSLTMRGPGNHGVHVNIGGSSLRGTVPTNTAGVSVMFRAPHNSNLYGGGTNQWVRPDLAAAELADAITDEHGRYARTSPLDAAMPNDVAAKTPLATWRGATPEARRDLLRAAGYTDADQARSLSGTPWADLTDAVKRALSTPLLQVEETATASPAIESESRQAENAPHGSVSAQDVPVDRAREDRSNGADRNASGEPVDAGLAAAREGAAGNGRVPAGTGTPDRAGAQRDGRAGPESPVELGEGRGDGAVERSAVPEQLGRDRAEAGRSGGGRGTVQPAERRNAAESELSSGNRSLEREAERVADPATAESSSQPALDLPPAESDHALDADVIGKGGLRQKYSDNLAAIRILKALAGEQRVATPDERHQIAQYVGWGALKGVFDPANQQWAAEHSELKALLTDAEWKAARASTLNAHYTSPTVVKAIFNALDRLGVTRGARVLEPSVGVGHFFGLMPASIRKGSQLHGVELDPLTSRIAAALYPSAKITQATGFQDFEIPSGYFDVAIGNPPFGSEPIVDDVRSPYSGFSIHNYFFAKSIDKLRPGGLMAMVVSHSFFDAKNAAARNWIAQHADLVDAVRLPNTAFKENAGTEVVTDIVVFRKRATGEPAADTSWTKTQPITLTGAKSGEDTTHTIGAWFAQHPDKVLGEQTATGSMYRADQYDVKPNGDLATQLDAWAKSLPEKLYQPVERTHEPEAADVAIPDGVKVGSFFVGTDGKVQVRGADALGRKTAAAWTAPNQKAEARVRGMIGLRDALRTQMRMERSPDATQDEIDANRATLNELYDDFKKLYGYVNDPTNRRLFSDDTESPLVQALEFDYDRGVSNAVAARDGIEPRAPKAKKADILDRRVLFPPSDDVKVENAKDALLASLNYKGRLDMDYMRSLYDRAPEKIVEELGDVVFEDPLSGLVMADEYLSGDVKTKLADAEVAAALRPELRRNVDALRKVIPQDKKPSEIHATLGAAWVPADVYQEFVRDLTGGVAHIAYIPSVAQWSVEITGGDAAKRSGQWGTQRMPADDLVALTMQGRAPVVRDTIRDGNGGTTTVVNERDTEAAREKQSAIKAEWQAWLWRHPERADKLASLYNDTMNRTVNRAYDGSHLTLPGMSPTMALLEHQANGVWRGLQSRQLLLDHVVGAGKTFQMVALALEMRRLGIARKPLLAVPNHLTMQWLSDFHRLYPAANVLAATPEDFAKGNREKFFSKMVTGDWDAVIIGHSSLKKVGLPQETEKRILDEQLNELAGAIEETKRARGDRNLIRDMERIKAGIEAKLKKKQQAIGERDKVLTFDELGVDAFMVDELHEFKNLTYQTQMDRVPGMGNPNGSDKAFDLFVKMQWLFDTMGDKAPIVGATGTPVSNSLVEMYNIQRFMQYPTLKRQGLHLFDAWAKQFGQVENLYEVAPSGTGYRTSSRFSKFANLPALMGLYHNFADVVTLDDLKAQEQAQGKTFPVPKIAGGRPQNVVAKRSPQVGSFMGVPKLQLDPNGKVVFDAPLADTGAEVVIAEGKNDRAGKFSATVTGADGVPHLIGWYDTDADARMGVVEAALSPKMTVDPNSILGQFNNLRALTKETKGKVNALSLTGQANKAGLDYRLIDPKAPDFKGSKINLAIERMMAAYKKWTKDKGAQLVFCDLSVPLSARANLGAKERLAYVRDDAGQLAGRRATLHSAEGFEDLPFLVLQRGSDKAARRFDVYDAASGVRLGEGGKTRSEARAWAANRLGDERQREAWIAERERVGEIGQDEIDDYNAANEIDPETAQAITQDDIAGMSGAAQFSVYDDIKAKLLARGVPESEIAFIHDYATPQAKAKLFAAVNNGNIRFLLGSTPKMGAGTNVQERLVALHHIDAPWRPSDLEQREGRIIRRGNKLYERDPDGFEVEIHRYATEQTYDTRRWQILEHKAAGIAQLRHYDGTTSEISDIDGEASNAADMKAAASGDPLILAETQLRNDVKRLTTLRAAHVDETHAMLRRARDAQTYAETTGPRELTQWQALAKVVAANPKPDDGELPFTLAGKKVSDRDAAVKALTRAAGELALGQSRDVDMTWRGVEFTLEQQGNLLHLNTPRGNIGTWAIGKDTLSPTGMFQRMDNFIARIDQHVANTQTLIEQRKADAVNLRAQANKPFEQQADLDKAVADHKNVQRQLLVKGPDIPADQKPLLESALKRQKEALREHDLGGALDEFLLAGRESGRGDFALADAGDRVDAAARESAAHPDAETPATAAQQEAGNHKMGHVNLHGLDVTIEVPKGGLRRGVAKDGTAWEREASDHYGYIKRTEAADGEQFDVYLGPHAQDADAKVFVIDQVRPGTNVYDESKAMIGFASGRAARASYEANFPKGLKTFGGIREMSIDEFKQWVKDDSAKGPATDSVVLPAERHSDFRLTTPSIQTTAADLANTPQHYNAIDKAVRAVIDGWGDNAPRVRVVDSAERLPVDAKREEPARYRQALGYYLGDTVYLVAPNLRSPAHALRILAHEAVGHYGVDQIVDEFAPRAAEAGKADKRESAMDKLVSDITHLRREGLGSEAMRSVMADVARRYPNADERTFAREVIAVAAEKNLRNGLIGRAIAALRAWARKFFPSIRFSENDLRAMLVRSARYLQEGPSVAERQAMVRAMAFAKAAPTDSAAFERWFGASKVMDKAGDPLVVHHGTGEEFTVFEPSRSGSATEHATSPLGHFFTEDRALAQRYAENASEGRPADERVIDAYLSIQKPYEMTLEQAQAIETPAQARALRAKLEGEGYDGIRIAKAKKWIAFESGQAKSVENRGTFDRSNPDINFALGDANDNASARVPVDLDKAIIGNSLGFASKHPDYPAAKAGDRAAGLRLAQVLVTKGTVEKVRAALGGAKPIIVPVVSVEAEGRNKIPLMAAAVLAQRLGLETTSDIVQANAPKRTGLNGLDRIFVPVQFSGDVKAGQDYLLLDDTLTQGGTFAALAGHIEANGGHVVAALALTGKQYSAKLKVSPQTLSALRAKHGDLESDFRATHGYGFDALTESEARYLSNFEPALEVRDRILAERVRAGSSLGASPTEAEAENDLTSVKSPSGDFSLPPADERESSPFERPQASVDAINDVLSGKADPSEGAFAKAKAWMAGKYENLVPALLGALQRRHLSELFAGSEPLKGYGRQIDELTQRMSADRNSLLTGAPDAAEHPTDMLKRGAATIATDLRNFAYQKGIAGFFGRKNPEAQVLARLMNDATLLGLDPSKPYQRLQMKDSKGDLFDWTPQAVKERIAAIRGQIRGRAGDDKTQMMDEVKRLRALKSREAARKAAWPELLARWQALSPEAQTLYRQMRDWYSQHGDATLDALIKNVELIGRDMAAAGNKEAAARFVRLTTAQMRADFEANRLEGVYFPLNRDGDFWVSFTDSSGASGFKMFEDAREQAAAVKKLRAAGFKIEATGRRDQDAKARDAVSGTFIADIITTLKKSGAPEKVLDEVYQAFLRTLPEMSMRKRQIHRKKIPGFDDDALRAFAKNSFHGSHQLARLRYTREIQSAMEAAQVSLDNWRQGGDKDPQAVNRADALLAEMKKRIAYLMNPNDSQLANVANGIGFIYYMGAAPASALVNLTQNAQVTLPVLGARFGWPKAARMLGAAVRDAMRTGGNIDRTLTNEEERQAYRVLRVRGDIDKTQSHTLAGLAEGAIIQTHPAWQKTMTAISWLFHKAEVVNREAAGMASYRLARSSGMNFNDAVQYASDIINGTHFDYAAENRPRYMQGNVARVALQFKNYSVGMSWMLYRNLYQAFKGETPQVRREAARTLTGILGVTALLSGTMGLPIMGLVKAVASAAHGLFGGDDDDTPWDFDTEFRQWLADVFGGDAAKWIADGAVNRTGINFARRTSLSNLWFQDSDRELEGKDAYYALLESLAGPVLGGMTKNFFVGTQQVRDGNVERGVETMMPTAAKSAMKALRFAHEGANTLRGDPIVPDITGPEAFMQAIGFQPTRLFEQQQANSALKNYEQAIRDRRQMLMNAYAMATRAGADTDVAMEKIHAFNRRYPEIAIKSDSLRQSLRARARYSAEQEGGVKIDKKLAPRLREMTGIGA